jgi:hypothetical protein
MSLLVSTFHTHARTGDPLQNTVPFLRTISVVLLSICTGCGGQASNSGAGQSVAKPAATWANPPKGLEFLRTVPELRGINLDISEADFLKLIESQELKVRADRSSDGETSYTSATPSGENVVVMFTDGACTGIQRLQPTPIATP